MKRDSRRFAMYGVAGFVVACLIFTATTVTPWSGLETMLSASTFPSGWRIPPSPPITIDISLSNFTGTHGIGSQANVTITVTSNVSLSDVILHVDIAKGPYGWSSTGIKLIHGERLWTGNLTVDIPLQWIIEINATEVGYGVIKATARWNEYWKYRSPDKSLGILVLENEIRIVKPVQLNESQSIMPPIFPPDFPLPSWPSPPPGNFTGP